MGCAGQKNLHGLGQVMADEERPQPPLISVTRNTLLIWQGQLEHFPAQPSLALRAQGLGCMGVGGHIALATLCTSRELSCWRCSALAGPPPFVLGTPFGKHLSKQSVLCRLKDVYGCSGLSWFLNQTHSEQGNKVGVQGLRASLPPVLR